MSLRASLLSMPRMLRHGSAVGADLPPDAAVTVDAVADPALRSALRAAATGDPGPARELLAETRLGARWETRSGWVAALSGCALRHPGWLERWLAVEPDNPDAVLLKAARAVQRAWDVRTGHRAGQVSEDRFRAFFALLEDAVPVISAATELNPADPVPWEIALTHARGAQSPRAVFDACWAEAVARSPYHYGCHTSALQYRCEKWYGSHGEMFGFAERAAARALPGSLLNALPLLAAVEYAIVAHGGAGDRTIHPVQLSAAVRRAQDLSAWYPPGDPEAAGFRNHLALMLIIGRRWDEALEVFREIGVHAREYPWAYLGPSRAQFLELRLGVRTQVASRTPFFSRPPRPLTPPAPLPEVPAPRALAIAAAPPHRVAKAALRSGVPLRIAPAPGPGPGDRLSYVELIPAGRTPPAPDEEPLTAAARLLTTGERWPVLVLRHSADHQGFTLVHRGRAGAAQLWDPTAPVVGHAEAAAVAHALTRAFPAADPRPLTALLRGGGDPARRRRALVAALGLPQVPDGFGEREEILKDVPGVLFLARRGAWRGLPARGRRG
ncbi:hypothetical protein [Streptomyces sp. NPDC020965]|uniref:hypothetical protein n=1 Tax=Streptomyces sp. NPDC020965 TaxID=3365105 RepID=UPI0037A0DC61